MISLYHKSNKSVFVTIHRRIRQDLQLSNIFMVDFIAMIGYIIATILLIFPLYSHKFSFQVHVISFSLAGFFALLMALKIILVVYLEKNGGDARQFVGSSTLVQSGVYAYSRNPVYVITMLQSLIWSVLLIVVSNGQSLAWIGYIAAPTLLFGHFWAMDRLIVPNEEAALKKVHGPAFDQYSRQVRRWL